MNKRFAYQWLSFSAALTLLACQAPGNLSAAPNPTSSVLKKTGGEESALTLSPYDGTYQDCPRNGVTTSCEIAGLMLDDFNTFKSVFTRARTSGKLGNLVAFELALLAMMHQRKDALDFFRAEGVQLSQDGFRAFETESLFHYSAMSRSHILGSFIDISLSPASADAFAKVDLATFRQLLSLVPQNVRPGFLQSVLYFAAAAGNLPVLEYLVSQGVDVQLEKVTPTAGARPDLLPPLYYALVFWRPQAARYLIRQGARIRDELVRTSTELQMHPLEENPPLSQYRQSYFRKNQLIYEMATQPRHEVKQMMQLLTEEPIIAGQGSANSLQPDLLSLAAGYPKAKPDIDAMRYLLEKGARSYGSVTINQTAAIPTAASVLFSQLESFAERKPALQLLLEFDPALNLRATRMKGTQADLETIDFIVEYLKDQPKELSAFKTLRTEIQSSLTRQTAALEPVCSRLIRQVDSGMALENSLIQAAISDHNCPSETIQKLLSETVSFKLGEEESVEILLDILSYRPELFARFLLNRHVTESPQASLRKLFARKDLEFDLSGLETLLSVYEQYFESESLVFSADGVYYIFNLMLKQKVEGKTVPNDLMKRVANLLAHRTNEEPLKLMGFMRQMDYLQDQDLFLEQMRLLISLGAEVNLPSETGRTPLMSASNLDVIKLLVEHGANINAVIKNNVNHSAYVPMKTLVNERSYKQVNNPPTEYASVFSAALSDKNIAEAKANISYLLSQNPEISLPDHADLLYLAADFTIYHTWQPIDLSLLQLILSSVSPDQRKVLLQDELLLYIIQLSGNGLTSIERAVEVERFFLEQGLDLEVRNRFYETPLILAAKTGFESMYQLLLKAGANPNARDIEGNSAKEIHDRKQMAMTPAPEPSAVATAQP